MNEVSTTLRKPCCSTMYDWSPNTLAASIRRSSNCATRSLGEPMNLSRVDARRGDRIRMAPHLAVLARGGHVDRPMARGADVAGAARLHGLEGAAFDFIGRFLSRLDVAIEVIGTANTHRVDAARDMKDVVQAFIAKVALFFGDPLLESTVRLNLERCHASSSCGDLAAADPRHLGRHDSQELDIALERQAGHEGHGLGDVLDVHPWLRPHAAVGLQLT